jgi:hypothetical protein
MAILQGCQKLFHRLPPGGKAVEDCCHNASSPSGPHDNKKDKSSMLPGLSPGAFLFPGEVIRMYSATRICPIAKRPCPDAPRQCPWRLAGHPGECLWAGRAPTREAAAVGCDPSYLCRLLKDRETPNLGTLRKKVLRVQPKTTSGAPRHGREAPLSGQPLADRWRRDGGTAVWSPWMAGGTRR